MEIQRGERRPSDDNLPDQRAGKGTWQPTTD